MKEPGDKMKSRSAMEEQQIMGGKRLPGEETAGSTSSKQGQRHCRHVEAKRRKKIVITGLMAGFCISNSITINNHPGTRASAELHTLFRKYSENGLMEVEHFHKFLKEVQQDHHVSKSDAKDLMETHNYARGTSESCLSTFNKQQFVDYVFDIQSNLAINTSVHHDMTRPMSHYFMFTGHNSYLTGNQLNSACSENPIVEALHQGVRVIELDLWPNSNKDDILVLHGRTWTSPVEFRKCIDAVKDNAFVKSEYPVIVTLEDHLPPDLQTKAAKIITETFGPALFHAEDAEGVKDFPSPESLKRRILISTKRPKEYICAVNMGALENVDQNVVKEAAMKKLSIWGHEIQDQAIPISTEGGHEEEDLEDALQHPEKCGEMVRAQDYKKIIAICSSKPKGKTLLNVLRRIEESTKRISLSETQFTKVAASYPFHIAQFTTQKFLRIYPCGFRLDSSNYNPIWALSHGAQMVAVNMQGYGKHLWVAQGFFRANGGCGYVKKPRFLLPENSGTCLDTFDPQVQRPVKQILKVKLCMGHGWLEHFGQSHSRFSLVKVGIVGVKADTLLRKVETLEDNWMSQLELEFRLRVPELALLRIEVRKGNNTRKGEFMGQTCLPVSELKSGYRAVPLCDKKGNEYKKDNQSGLIRLLLHLELRSLVQTSHSK